MAGLFSVFAFLFLNSRVKNILNTTIVKNSCPSEDMCFSVVYQPVELLVIWYTYDQL